MEIGNSPIEIKMACTSAMDKLRADVNIKDYFEDTDKYFKVLI